MAWRRLAGKAEAGWSEGRPAGARRRVLEVVGQMKPGGVETWLLHALRRMDRGRIGLDFLVFSKERGAYDEAVRAAGGRLLACPDPRLPLLYARNLSRILREEGPYDVVHSHMHHFSGLDLWVARRAGVGMRICQSHLDTSGVDREAGTLRKGYLAGARRLIGRSATHLLAVSEEAGAALYGDGCREDARYRLLHCGVDFERFAARPDRGALRARLGIPSDAKVIGTVGRLAAQKNQAFLLEIAWELARRDPRWWLVMVGDGPLRASLRSAAAGLGLSRRIVWAGARTDVENVLPALDAFVFPSAYEGLCLAPMEAQGAGLPCFVSSELPPGVTVVDGLMKRLPLAAGPAAWADAIEEETKSAPKVSAEDALATLRSSAFDIGVSSQALEQLYLG